MAIDPLRLRDTPAVVVDYLERSPRLGIVEYARRVRDGEDVAPRLY
jgi:hypothetical protein